METEGMGERWASRQLVRSVDSRLAALPTVLAALLTVLAGCTRRVGTGTPAPRRVSGSLRFEAHERSRLRCPVCSQQN